MSELLTPHNGLSGIGIKGEVGDDDGAVVGSRPGGGFKGRPESAGMYLTNLI